MYNNFSDLPIHGTIKVLLHHTQQIVNSYTLFTVSSVLLFLEITNE
jgi:hypothetical protein